jgi:hypothetical protein
MSDRWWPPWAAGSGMPMPNVTAQPLSQNPVQPVPQLS